MPAWARARTPAASRKPGVPSRPATTKNVACSPRPARAGSACSRSDALPSSNVMRTSPRPAAASRTAANCLAVTHTSRSRGSGGRGGSPTRGKVGLMRRGFTSSDQRPVRACACAGHRRKKPAGRRVGPAMETVAILRTLWARRRLAGAVLVLAVLVGAAMAYRLPSLQSRSYQVGVATSRVFVDTPSSQVVEVSPKGGDTLGTRAGLIASLMVDGTIKDSIARRAGLRPGQFDAVSESAAETSPAVAKPTARARVLMTSVVTNAAGDDLPIIQIQAQAADARQAARLAAAAVSGLRDYLNTKAAQQRVPGAKRLQVTGLGAPQAADVTRGPRRLIALIAVLVVALGGCAAIVVGSRIEAAWRAEQAAGEEPDTPAAPEPVALPKARSAQNGPDVAAPAPARTGRFDAGKRAREAARLGEASR